MLRTLALGVAVALATGCASSPSTGLNAEGQAIGSQAAMSNKGLANLTLAQNYLASGQTEYAIDRANRALRSDPDSADVQIVLGMIREKLGDSAGAGAHYARGVKLAPTSGHVLNVHGVWLCQQGKAADADQAFARAVRDPFYKTPDQALFNAGKCAMQAGQLDKAEAYLRQGLQASPENPALLARMAELQFQRRDYMSARAFYQRRESLGKTTPELLNLAISIEQAAGDTVAAQRYMQRLKEQFPDYTPPATEGSSQ
ncbi:type IV pilus biogenesis/stability protein PilW [Arenimonas sp. MALMAid1274]|uniref:type IV pilus biogenesis/stability protein PilW n=1 Tax=Arenimonas sp. MALMAid1274 TaxID=3411630 RepID=UPI003BA10E6D